MSITSSFYTGLSGLSTHGTAMGVIGDNISNINTTGYKNSSPAFEDILGQSLSGVQGSNQTGAGTNVQSIDVNYIQGTFSTTEVPTDVAINGKGFFVVKDSSTNEQFYTRAGHYHFDNQGYYVNNEGKRVQGYLYDNAGTSLIESLSNIQVNQNSMIAPQVTTTAEMILNLDSTASVIDGGWDIDDPNGTSNFSSPITIYDSLGQAHVIQVYFTNISTGAAPRTWEWHAIIASSDTSVGGEGYTLFGQGETADASLLEFDEYGILESPDDTIDFHDQSVIDITYANGVDATDSTIDFRGTTQYGAVSAVQRINQNGYGPGAASAIAIDEQGNLTANYTNGQVKKIARLAVANFPNINGLQRQGGTLYSETVSSGQPLINKPGVGGMGTISSSMLEESNVDLAGEIIKMIIIQRGYEANSKVISTTDAMMNTLINIR
jgi:flagellar hook protein FlgE